MDAIIVRRYPTEAPTFVPSFLDELWNRWTPTVYEEQHSSIPMDMYELKDDLVIRAELPGFKKEDIDISIQGEELTLKATRKPEQRPEDSTRYMCELCDGDYARTVSLPFEVDSGKVSAVFENGLLEVRLPKREEAKAKHIEVK